MPRRVGAFAFLRAEKIFGAIVTSAQADLQLSIATLVPMRLSSAGQVKDWSKAWPVTA